MKRPPILSWESRRAAAADNQSSSVAAMRAELVRLRLQVGRLEEENRRCGEGGGRRLQDWRRRNGDEDPAEIGECKFERRQGTNINRLLTADGDGRCEMRYSSFRQAARACAGNSACVGVVRDNGLRCRGKLLRFELRGGFTVAQTGHVAWVCPAHLKPPVGHVAPHAQGAKAGFVFMLLGDCAKPDHACNHVLEIREAMRSIRALGLRDRPIAILSDGGIPHEWVWEHLKPDLVTPLRPSEASYGNDRRGQKLQAYMQSPFERSVFLDGDTYVRDAKVEMLFDALKTFELAAAFECCRVDYSSSRVPYDQAGFFRGWEMQTGVMAVKRTPRVLEFWRATHRIYREGASFWAQRSSAEQGAATLALAESDVRFLPLPPSFNARPFTMYQYVKAFGAPVYHGKELWQHKGLRGEALAPPKIIDQRMVRDWSTSALQLVRAEFGHAAAVQDSPFG